MSKIAIEKKTLATMTAIYCKSAGPGDKGICRHCEEVLTYAYERLDHCKFGENKPSCKACPVHCYKPDMRERIKLMMRYSGPRMIYRAPLAAIRHMFG
jgi:hypothetical protein